jgi:hypothetical protein
VNEIDTPQSICQLGLARGDVTPPVGIYHRTWGAARQDRAEGVHRPLAATALILRPAAGTGQRGDEQVLIALDLCLLGAREITGLLAAVCGRNGLETDQVVVAFSHTHAGGLMGLDRVGLPGGDLIPPYLESLSARVAELVKAARASARPVTITYGQGRCTLAAHRDLWDSQSNQFVCGFNPAGPADDTVLVARVTDEAGGMVVSLVNYACHPTTLAWQNALLSPDYPGAMRQVVEHATGAPCVFLQGASGDLGPREGFVGDPTVADRNGRQLGYAALAALESLPPPLTRFRYAGPVVSGATLGTWEHVALDEGRRAALRRWRCRRWTIELPYRSGLLTEADARAEQQRWQREETDARDAGDEHRARDCRALAERMTRWLARLLNQPPGPTFPLPVTLWQFGDALWLAVEGEHYQHLQVALRQRFPKVPIVVMTLANGSRPTYLPTRDAYGKGIYQESIAVLAAGCLESLTEEIGDCMQAWLKDAEKPTPARRP